MMMATDSAEHICMEKDQLSQHTTEITELKARAEFKEKRIDDLSKQLTNMDTKLDQLNDTINNFILKSVTDDNELNQRVTSLENTVQVLKWIVSVVFGSGVLWIILNIVR